MAHDPDTADVYAFPKADCQELHAQTGMTLRDYFAAAALTGYLASTAVDGLPLPESHVAATTAYNFAAAMMDERRRRGDF
jgi:hypothetical protein